MGRMGQTGLLGQMARWAAVAAVAAGAWVGSARDARADYVRADSGWLGNSGKLAMSTDRDGYSYAWVQAASSANGAWFKFDNDGNWTTARGCGKAVSFNTYEIAYENGANGTLNITSGRWYTFCLQGNSDWGNRHCIVMETTGEPVTITGVSDNSAQAGAADVTVTATLSDVPSSENVYIGYTTDNWSTRSAVKMSQVGATTTYKGVIPGKSSGTTVKYYVFTSTAESCFISDPNGTPGGWGGGKNAWFCAIQVNNNSGSNYSYTVSSTTKTWVTGLDEDSMLVNWSSTGSSVGYDVKMTSATAVNIPFTETFLTSYGWTSFGSTDVNGGVDGYTDSSNSGRWSYNYGICEPGSSGYLYNNYRNGTSAYIELPPLTGLLTGISIYCQPNSKGTRGWTLKLYDEVNDEWIAVADMINTWSGTALTTITYTFPSAVPANGLRVRLYGYNAATVKIRSLTVSGNGVAGHSQFEENLSEDTTYSVQTQPKGGTWSTAISAKTGVMPSALSSSPDSTSIAFSWTGHANASGYKVDATRVDASAWSDIVCPNETLDDSGPDWHYVGGTITGTGEITSAPTFRDSSYTGNPNAHMLVGKAWLGIVSPDIDIAGATSVTLSFTVGCWNLGSANGKLEAGRVNAYYSLDGGPWCFFGTGLPKNTTTPGSGNSYSTDSENALSFTVPQGALDGSKISFKLVAPAAEKSNTTYLRGAYIKNLKVECDSVGLGDYTTHVTGYPKVVSGTSETVTGLSEGEDVYFRVQALQGSDTANPDARSVWVETSATAAPALIPQTTAVGVTEDTFTWNTTYDSAGGIQLTGSGGNGTTGSAYTFRLVSSTIADSGSVSSSGFLSVTKAGGTFTVAVTHTADGYESRTDNVTITVNKGSQTITGLSSSYTKDYGSGTFTLSATSGSGLAVSYNIPSGSSGVATVSGSTVTIVGVGTATITASQAGNDLWDAAPNKTANLTVRAVNPTVTSGSVTDITATSATMKGTVTALGGAASLSAAGAAYKQGTSGSPNITDDSVASASSPVAGTEFSATATGLTPGTAYRWRAYGTTSESKTGYGSAATFYTKCATPTAPSGLTLERKSVQRIDLSWTAGALGSGGGDLHYLVLRTTSAAPSGAPVDGTVYSAGDTIGDWTVAAVLGDSATTRQDTGLSADTVYYYKVYSYAVVSGQNATCAYSTTGPSGSEVTESAVPTAWTSGVTCDSVGGKRATLSWTANEGANGCDGYMVVIKQGASAPANDVFTQGTIYSVDEAIGDAGAIVKYVGPNHSSVTISGLNGNTKYTAKVFAWNGNNYRAYRTGSSSVTFTTTDVTGPTVRATGVDTTGYLLNWGQLSSDSSGYDVETRASGGNWASAGSALPGYNKPVTGLTSGSTYEARVRKSPDGDWSDELSVKAGVKPNTVSASAVRNAVTFTWTDVQTGAAGYGVQVTKTASASSLYTKTCPSSALGRNSFSSGEQWKYTGDQVTCTSGNFNTSPGYRTDYGHILIGTGQTLESDAFALDGMTALQLKFTIKTHNSTSGTADNQVDAYYQVNGGVWNWLGSANTATSHALTVPQGAIDEASTIAFRLVAPNAYVKQGSQSTFFACPAIDAISVKATAKGSGDYDAPVTETTTSSQCYTVSGLTAGEKVYFRVQALQGSTANPTAKSVWVEATGTATAYTAPGTPVLSDVTRNSMTATWTAGDTTDLDHYEVQWSTSSTFATTAGSANVAAGTLTKAISGLTASTTYYVRVRAVGTDSQYSAWSGTGNAETSGFGGPATVTASGETRNGMTLTWDAVSGASGYVVQWTTCPGGGADTLVSSCADGTTDENRKTDLLKRTMQVSEWSWQSPNGSTSYPQWSKGNASSTDSGTISTPGHNLMSPVAYGTALTQQPALISERLDLSGYTGGYVSFSHASRVSGTGYSDPYAQVTLYYSTDDGANWTKAGTASGVAGGSWTTGRRLEIPAAATGAGKTSVRLKLQADSATTKYSSGNVYTGPMLKDVKVYCAASEGDYDCETAHAEVSVSGGSTTTYVMTGLDESTTYYFRVLAVGSGDGARSTWTEGQSATTAFEGPENVRVTGTTRYTLTAGWDAYTESGYTTTYVVKLSECGTAADGVVATCPDEDLGTTGTGVWTYRMSANVADGEGDYPDFKNGGHDMRAAQDSMTTQPAVVSPVLDMSGYGGGTIEFKLWSRHSSYKDPYSKVSLYYSVNGGTTWTKWATTAAASGSSSAGATAVSVALPVESVGAGKTSVRYMLSADDAVVVPYSSDGETGYVNPGPVVKSIVINGTSSGVGGFDDAGCIVASDSAVSGTTKTFENLTAGKTYYVQVQTVLTPTGSGSSATSAGSQASGATLDPMSPPEEIWAENIRQAHMTLAWSEAPGADEDTLYKYEVTKCGAGSSTVTAAAETRTDGDLEEGVDDWTYVGGGTAPESTQQTTYGFERETYPAWAKKSENSIVLAGAGNPGIESIEFSTVGASAGTVTFLHGRWYDANYLSMADVTLSYSIDGGESWTDGGTTGYNDLPSDGTASKSRTMALPSGALGHAHVKVRLEARSAADTAGDPSDANYVAKPVGAAIKQAKVELTKQGGDYEGTGCRINHYEDLTYDQLMAELSGLESGTMYYFRVAASDGVQYGAWTENLAKTLAVPAAPASAWVVPSSIGRHAMTVQWDAVAEAESYVVRVYSDSGRTTQVGADHAVEGTTYVVTGLTADTPYYFTVQSVADGCQSSGVATCDGRTGETLAVTGFMVTNILDTSLTVKWDNVADTTYRLEAGPMTTNGATGALYETIECPATTLKRSDAGNGWFYLGGNASYPKYYVKSTGTAEEKAADQGHVLSYSSGGAPGIQSRWFSTYGAKSAKVEFLHGRWYNNGANSAIDVYYTIDGGVTWTLAGSLDASTSSTPSDARSLALPARALGQRTVAVRLLAPDAMSGGSYGYGAEIKDLKVKLESYPQSASVFDGTVSGGSKDLSGLTVGQRYWFRLTASETYEGTTYTADAITTAATRKKTTGVLKSQGFEGPSGDGALDTTAWGYAIKWIPVQNGSALAHTTQASGDPEVAVVDGENPLYGDRSVRMSGSSSASTYGVLEFANTDFGTAQNVAVTIPFAARDLAEGENLWVTYSVNGGSTWVSPDGLTTLTKSGMTLGKIGRGGSDVINQNWPYNRGSNTVTRPAGDAYVFEVHGASQLAVRVLFCGNSGGAKHYYYIDGVTLERLATPPSDVTAVANTSGTVDLGWTPAGGQSVVIIRGQDKREAPASLDLDSLPHGYEVVTNATGTNYWVNTADPAEHTTTTDAGVTGGWKYFYYFYGALKNADGTYTLSKEYVQKEVIVRGMVQAIASQGWDGWDVHPWSYKKGRTTNPGQAGDCGFWAFHQSGDTLPYAWAHFVEGSWEYDGEGSRTTSEGSVPAGVRTYASIYGPGGTYGADDADKDQQLGLSSYTNYFGTNCFRLSGGSGWTWNGSHTWTNNEGDVKTQTAPTINTNNAAIQFETIDLSGYKNVQFSFHYAQTYSGGGNYMHVAISTNGNGANGTWLAYDNKNDGNWRKVDSSRDYGLQLQTMTGAQTGGNVDFYDESRAPYGNPFVLDVPDAVTQITVRLTFFDTTAKDQRAALIFVDEVRLTGEVAIEPPKPYISEIGKDRYTVHWEAVPDADSYDVEVTAISDETQVKLAEAFAVKELPEGWTKSDSGVTFTKTASHLYSSASSEHDFGLNLSGQSGMLTSPEVGGTTNLHFWAKAYNSSGSAKLVVQAKGAEETEWETVAEIAAGDLSDWTEFECALPNRQWTQVRFSRSGGTGTSDSLYVDDIEFRGVGVYTGTVAYSGNVTATNVTITGLSESTRYLAHVRSVGSPAGYEVRSTWAETADYTAGTVYLQPDGFEMVRIWGGAGDGMLVVASAGDAAIGTPTNGTPVGGAVTGGGTVVAHLTGTVEEGANAEHVVPANSQVNYAVFWKHGNYWEGRYETNFWMGKYGSPVADAFAQTNGIAPAAFVSNGAGWASAGTWSAWDESAGHISIGRGSAYPYGLLGSNQLFGAGGNMIKFDMGTDADSLKVRAGRDFATAFTGPETWFMFTVRCEYGANNENKMWGMQLLSATGGDAYKSVIASVGKLRYLHSGVAKLAVDTSCDTGTSWLGGGYPDGSGITWSDYQLKDYGNSGDTNAIWTIVGKYVRSTGKLSVKAYYTPDVSSASGGVFGPKASAPTSFDISNVSAGANKDITGVTLFGYGWNGDLYFDEIRFGPSWSSLIEEPSPPQPVTSVRAIPDGKELVRLDWTYAASSADYPDAEGVLVLDKATAWTDADITAAKPVNGQPYVAGATIGGATVAFIGSAGRTISGVNYQDLVVDPGSTHYYRVYAYSSYIYTNGVAASGVSPSAYPAVMGTYLENEHVDTFSYTNATTAGTTWKGGKGFENGESDKHYWGDVTGTWTAMLPATQPGYDTGMPTFGAIEGYPTSAGNLVKLTNPGANAGGSMKRDLQKVFSAADTNFYVAFRMAYQYEGANKWAGLSLLDSEGVEKGFVGKGGGSYWYTLCVGLGDNKSWGDDLRGYYGDASKTYLVIMRYNWENKSLSAMTVQQGGQVPNYEPTVWPASVGLDIPGIKKLMLQAGGTGDGVTIGDVWFDELRYGTSWTDILSGVCADEIAGAWWQKQDASGDLEQTYLGNTGRFLVRSAPVGFGQEAWLKIDWTGGASGHGVTTNKLSWLKNEGDPATHTWWSNEVQVVETGYVGGPGATATWPAEASVTAMNADCVVVEETTRLEVLALGAPTGVSAAYDAVKSNSVINVSWTPWTGTLTGVDTTTKDVLIVRFSGTSSADALAKAADAANQPIQGHAYMAGDSIGEGTVVWRGGDGGAVRTTPAKGLMPDTWYAFAVYTENYSYYSEAVIVSAKTEEGGHTIDIDGDPTDWYGEAPDTLNTAWVNLGEFIWKDKTGEERHSAGSGDTTVGNPSSDIDEFRVYADENWVYFLVKMTNITDATLPYVAVGLDDRKSANSTAMNWLGDESATEIGSNYWATTAAAHYPRWQLNVHQVTGQGTQVEQYNHQDCNEWFAPQGTADDGSGTQQGWAAEIGTGVGQAVEFRVARSDIGLSGMAEGATKVQRFTVASFKNTGVWNNQGGATAEIYGGTSKAVDALGIAPQRPKSKPDNDYLLSSWDEDISDGNIDFWVDVTFDKKGIVENARPAAPSALVFPAQNAELKSSPTFRWTRGSDTDGNVTGYMLEVSTDPTFDDLNGTVELRVNVAALESGETASTEYGYAWGGAHQQTMYYWRVRSRDNGGRLSAATNGVFWVKEDGDGPVAVLKYVGTDVDGYMAGNYAQLEKLYPEALLSVTDEDIEKVLADPNKRFGFVIEWTDPNGVYATNQIREGASGTRVDGYASSYAKGAWAWNISSGDGRVSPNWDLVEFHMNYTDRETTPAALEGNGKWTTNFWDETGCWGWEWGYDDAFMVGPAGDTRDQTRGANGDPVITNLVRSAFEMHTFDTNVDYYLTVSAEDCTTWKESGSGWWDDGSWKSFKARGESGAPGDDYSSGWCLDGPNRARNVTTNQLLKILVRDNDVTAPGASSSLWGGKGLVVTTNDAAGAPAATPAKQLTLEEGTGLPVWTVTDEELVGRPLAFHFNVYDSSMTGIKVGTAATESVTKGSRTTTMTNSAFLAALDQRVDGRTQTVTWTNWAQYDASRSSLLASGEGMGAGTAPASVLTWFWPAATGLAHIEDFWPRGAKGPDGLPLTVATNAITLSLWDLDNNRDGDQAGADVTLGYLKISDDDAKDPVLSSVSVTGTGIGAEAGALGSWTLSQASDTSKSTDLGMTLSAVSGVADGVSKTLSGSKANEGVWPNDTSGWSATKKKGLEFTVTGVEGMSYVLNSISFDAQFRATTPEHSPQNWGLFSSAENYETELVGGTFDLSGEEGEDGTMTYAVKSWNPYGGAVTAAARTGATTYRLLLWRTDADSTTSQNVAIKNLSLVGTLTDSRYATAVTDGDLANGRAVYTLNTHDVDSGVLASGKAYPEDVAEKADGRPEITFGRQSGNTPVNGAKLAISTPTPASGKVAKGDADVAVKGTVGAASKKEIDVNDAGGKGNPWSYRLSATVWDADTDRPGDTRTATATQASIPVYDDDYKEPVRGSGMQGGALGAMYGDLSTFAPGVGSGTNREYRINDRQLQQMITAGTKLYIGASFYDYSGWTRPTLSVTEGGVDASSVLTMASGDGMVPTFDTNATVNSSSATAYWTMDKTLAMGALNTNIAAGGFSATYAIQAASITDLDDDRQDSSGANIDSKSASNMNLGLVTFLDNDTGQPYVQTNYSEARGEWMRTVVGIGAGPQASGWRDALVNTELTNDTSVSFRTASATNRVYDSELAETSANPFQIRVPTVDYSGGHTGQSAQGIQVGTERTTPVNGVTLTNSYLQLTNTTRSLYLQNRANWSSELSSSQADTKIAARFPKNVWTWSSLSTNDVGNWLPSGMSVIDWTMKIGLYDADSDRNGDQKFREVDLGTLRVQDDDTTPPGAVTIDFSASKGISSGAGDRDTAAWTNSLTEVEVTFGAVEDGEPVAGDLHKSAVAGYRIGDTVPAAGIDASTWGADLETTTAEDVVTARLSGAMTADNQGLTSHYVAAMDNDADRPGDQLLGTADAFTVAYDITPPTVVNHLSASTDTVDDPTTQFALSWTSTDVGPDDPTHENWRSTWTTGTGPRDRLSPWASYKIYYGTYDPEQQKTAADVFDSFVGNKAYMAWSNVVTTSVVEDESAPKNAYAGLASAGTGKVTLYDLDFDRDYVVVIVGVDKAGNEGPALDSSWATNNTIKFAVTQGVMRAWAEVDRAYHGIHNMKPTDKGAAALYWIAATNAGGQVTKEYDLFYRDATSFNESSNNTWTLVGTVTNNWFVDAGALEQSANKLRFYRASYKDRWQRTRTVGEEGSQEVITQRPLMSEDVYGMTAVPLLEGQNYVSLHGYGVGGGQTNTLGAIFGTDTNFWPVGGTAGQCVRLDVYSDSFKAGGHKTPSRQYYLGTQKGQTNWDWYLTGGGKSTDVIDQDIFKHGVAINLPEISKERRDLVVTNSTGEHNAIYWHPVLLVPTNNILPEADSTDSFTVHVKAGSARSEVTWNLCSFVLPVACHPAQLGLPIKGKDGVTAGFGPSTMKTLTATCDVIYAYDSVNKKLRDGSGMFLGLDEAGTGLAWRSIYGNCGVVQPWIKPFYPNDMIIINTRSGGSDWTWTYSPTNFYNLPTRWGGW